MAGKAFISYRENDADFHHRLVSLLQPVIEPTRLIDSRSLSGNSANGLREQIRDSDIVLAIIGHDWARPLASPQDHVRMELEEVQRQRRYIILIVAADAEAPAASELPRTILPLMTYPSMRISNRSLEDGDVHALTLTILQHLRHPDGSPAPNGSAPPEIPEQGYGPHFEIGDDGIVTLAPPAALDRQGNNIDRLKRMHPELRDLSRELAEALGKGNIPHVYLLERAKAYHRQIDRDLDRIDFSLLHMAGVRLANAEKAAAGDSDLPPLALPVRETIDSLLQFHGTFILATREGLESIAAEQRYRRTRQEEVDYRKAALDFARSLQDQPTVVDAKAAAVVMTAAEDIGQGANPERSGTVATGAMKNIAVTIAAGAAIGAIPVAAVAVGSTALAALTGPACLIATESLKKSKSFAALTAAVTKGIDTMTDMELSDALRKVRELFAPQVRFLLSAKEQLGQLAGRSDDFKWLTRAVRWVEQEVQARSPVAVPSTDPPPAREPQPPPAPPEPGLLGNIYLGQVTAVEPSLQAAFVEYGSDRHGLLSVRDIHPDDYQISTDRADDATPVSGASGIKIQDVVTREQIMLVQVIKEARGNRGAALTTYLSLAGHFLVLMPNHAGVAGVSNKIVDPTERERLKAMLQKLPVPSGMQIILREAGATRSETEIENDLAELVSRWKTLRELSQKSKAPALIYDASPDRPAPAPSRA